MSTKLRNDKEKAYSLTLNVVLEVVRCRQGTPSLQRRENQVEGLVGFDEYEVFILRHVDLVSKELLAIRFIIVLTNRGYEDTMMDGVGSLGRLGRRCHSSSVTKGIKGWSKRKP